MTDTELLDNFLGRRDASAFESLVRRHGPLVLRVCRDVLDDPDEAEDAFQATFLVLVRRAGTIRDPDSLGRWLHGVANRVALRARTNARRREARERRGVEMAAMAPDHDQDALWDVRPVLHTELDRLPEKLRAPLVLCYLEEHSYEEAARRLRLPLGTLKARLSRGRELLRARLTRRGIAVSMLLLVALLGEKARAVPPGLVDSTVNAGCLVARRHGPLPATIPARVAALVEHEAGVHPLRGWAALATLALLVGVSGLFVARAVRASPTLTIKAVAPASPPGGCGCHGG